MAQNNLKWGAFVVLNIHVLSSASAIQITQILQSYETTLLNLRQNVGLIHEINKILCILYNQRDATYTVFFIIISALHVSGGFSAHHQELIKLYV